MDADKKFIIGTVIVTLVLLVGAVVWATSQTPRVTPETTIPQEILVSDRAYNVMGNPAAPVTLVEFSDPQCPACRAANPDVKAIMELYEDQVQFVYRHFPLPMHPQAVPAAHAIEAAGLQGKFFQMLDGVFANQERLSEGDSLFEEIAVSLDMDIEQFNQDRRTNEIAALVKQDTDVGNSIGVNSTPTFFVNGRVLPVEINKTRFQSLQDAINQALSEQQIEVLNNVETPATDSTELEIESDTESTPSGQ